MLFGMRKASTFLTLIVEIMRDKMCLIKMFKLLLKHISGVETICVVGFSVHTPLIVLGVASMLPIILTPYYTLLPRSYYLHLHRQKNPHTTTTTT